MTIWEFFWNVKEGGLTILSGILILLLVIVGVVFVIYKLSVYLFKTYILPKIDKAFETLDIHDKRIRDLEEESRSLKKSDETMLEYQKTQADLAKEMVYYANSTVDSMKQTCLSMQELNIALGEKAKALRVEIELIQKEIVTMKYSHDKLLTEHNQRHAGEIPVFKKPRNINLK
jgi:uncharacterized protein YoxC